jgi:oxygen-independent coproporphyrinogen-3 oxidase
VRRLEAAAHSALDDAGSGVTTAPSASPAGVVAGELEAFAGSYFVSTYPPFSCWSRDDLAEYEAALAAAPVAPSALGLYVHIPFCEQRCPYCYYLSYAGRESRMQAYTEALVREAQMLASRPALRDRAPSFVYVGGGTPSLLTVAELSELLGGLKRSFPWQGAEEVCFECAPRSVSADKLRLLRQAGVTRLSMGVQAFDDEVLRANGRIHGVADVERAWELIAAHDFTVVNLDLMVGLAAETDESFFAGIERVLDLAPQSVTLYQLEIPLNTPLYRALEAGSWKRSLPSWDAKRARLAQAFALLEAGGYRVRSAYAAVRDPERHRFVYQEAQYLGADLVGLGVSAFGYLQGVHHQNLADLERYLGTIARDELPLGRAHRLDGDERLVRELVLQLKLGGCDTAALRDRHGVDVVDRYAEVLAGWARQGWLEVGADELRLTPAGLVRVDELLPELYLPRHRDVRYS